MFGRGTESLIFLGIALLLVAGEMVWRRLRGGAYDFSAFKATVGIFFGQTVISVLASLIIVGVWTAAYSLSPVQFGLTDWRIWVIGFLVMEFAYYWQHRLGHTVRWMWATHSVHHSPNQFVLPAAFRLGWTGLISGSWLVYALVALVGFHPLMIATLLVINLRFQFFLHTEHIGRLGRLEWVLNTPSNHRVHHSSRAEYLDKNFGGMTMIFDHLFATYAAEQPGVDLKYGLTDPITSNNPFVIAFREWGRLFGDVYRAPSVSAALKAAFGRPAAQASPTTHARQ